MGKLKEVKSKYTLPDKYIEKLKREAISRENIIKNREHDIEQLKAEKEILRANAYGNHWFSFTDPGHEMGVNLSGYDAIRVLESLRIGTKIVCFGDVVAFTRSKNGKNEATMHIKDVYLKRT